MKDLFFKGVGKTTKSRFSFLIKIRVSKLVLQGIPLWSND